MKPLHADVSSPTNLTVQKQNNSDHRHRIKHSSEKAKKYCQRKPQKHAAEMALIDRALTILKIQHHPDLSPISILDAPCGVGRATIYLAQKGYATTGIDLGDGALKIAREQVALAGVTAQIDKGDLLNTPYSNHHFDAVLCFRFFHHLPTPTHRQQIVRELCRVSQRYVLISYLSKWSATSIKRQLKERFTGKKSLQHQSTLTELKGYFETQGFQLIQDFAQTPLVHSLHLAIFERKKCEQRL